MQRAFMRAMIRAMIEQWRLFKASERLEANEALVTDDQLAGGVPARNLEMEEVDARGEPVAGGVPAVPAEFEGDQADSGAPTSPKASGRVGGWKAHLQ